jgi:hypothetical protein
MIARKDFTQEISIKGLTEHLWPRNFPHRAVPEGGYFCPNPQKGKNRDPSGRMGRL